MWEYEDIFKLVWSKKCHSCTPAQEVMERMSPTKWGTKSIKRKIWNPENRRSTQERNKWHSPNNSEGEITITAVWVGEADQKAIGEIYPQK